MGWVLWMAIVLLVGLGALVGLLALSIVLLVMEDE